MRLRAVVLGALLAAVVAAADAEDLPPVDKVVEQARNGELTPEQLADMFENAPETYIKDVKHGLPHELKQRIGEIFISRLEATEGLPSEVTDEPAHEDQYEDYQEDEYDETAYNEEEYEEAPAEEATEEEPAEEPVEEPELGPVEEPVEEEGVRPLRAGAPRLRAGEPDGPGEGNMGGSGGSTGGVLPHAGVKMDEAAAARLLLYYSQEEQKACQNRFDDAYKFYTADNTLGPNKVRSEVEYLKVWRLFADNATNLDLSGVDRTDLVAVFMLLENAGVSALDDQQLTELVTALTNLETAFSRAEVCDFYDETMCNLKLYKDIRVKLATSTDEQELAHYWLTWRGLLARNTAQYYADYVRLLDTAAKRKHQDSTAWSLLTYPYAHGNAASVLNTLERLWEKDISPLYEELHSYARRRLRERYGTAMVPKTGPIPAHLFGSHEADDWSALEELMRPYDNASMLDFHGHCVDQNVDVGLLKQVAGKLYSNLGLNQTSLTDLTLSRLNVAAADADSVTFLPRVLDGCHTTRRLAVGIYPTNTTLSDYIELIELFGTMQEYIERAGTVITDKLGFPYKERMGFNGYGLDLAIGGARALAATSPEGLKALLGFQLYDVSEHAMMNFQMAHALKLLPRLAASMAAVRWQADVMTGAISQNQYNSKWWEYKEKYQGISPPEDRDSSHFDAFADGTLTLPNYHIRRLIGGLTMFSVHKYHCRMYGDASTPLSECAIFDNLQLGNNIRSVLVSGNSKPLKDQLQALTGERELSAAALVEQLQPVSEWLVHYNQDNDIDDDPINESSDVIAIIVGVVIAVIIVGLVIFFVVAKRRQRYQDYKDAPTREAQHA